MTNSGRLDKIFQFEASSVGYTEKKYDYPDFAVNTGDALYFGDSGTFSKLAVDLTTGFAVNCPSWIAWEYWNGSAWTAVDTLTDTGTINSKALTQDGEVSWNVTGMPDWATCTPGPGAGDDTLRYYVRAMIKTPLNGNYNLTIHETLMVDPPTYTVEGAAPWTLDINPYDVTPHPGREQTTHRTMGGSVNIQTATGDGAVRTMIWRGLDEDTWDPFINGRTEHGKFDKVYFYNENVFISAAQSPKEKREIVDQTFQSYTRGTTTIPFKSSGVGYSAEPWVADSNFTVADDSGAEDATVTVSDRLFLGMNSKFYGINVEFEKSATKFLTDYIDSDLVPYISQIQLRFSPSDGDLAAGDSVTITRDSNASDDGTEMFAHDGQIIWTASDVPNWSAVNLNTIIDATSDLYPISGFRDEEDLYYVELQLTFRENTDDPKLEANDDHGAVYYLLVMIANIRTAIDSLDYLSLRRSDGTVPYWYLFTPSSLEKYRPRGHRDDSWVPIKVVDVVRESTHVKKRWDVTMSYVIATDYEAPQPFSLDKLPIDGKVYLVE